MTPEMRTAVVAEATSWIGTPYHMRGRVKGAGADCGSLLLAIAVACGLIADEELEAYSADCWVHWSDEKYMRHILRYTVKMMEAVAYRSAAILPGTLVLTRTKDSKWFNHGAFVIKWPMIVHAVHPAVELADATSHPLWAFRTVSAFDFPPVTSDV